jgi:hypothetical protein
MKSVTERRATMIPTVLDIEVDIDFEIYPAVYGRRENGVQIEPDLPRQVEITSVVPRGSARGKPPNLLRYLNESQILYLEDQVMEGLTE